MLDFFSILSKGGLVLWYFQADLLKLDFQAAVNEMIKYALIDKNSGTFHYDKLALQSELDNEFDLVFIVGYQNFLQLAYIDKLLTEVKKRFRDMYKNRLEDGIAGHLETNFDGFDSVFKKTLAQVEYDSKNAVPKKPRAFQQSEKSSKTIKGSGLIETKEEKKRREQEESRMKQLDEPDEDEIQRNIERMKGSYGKSPKPAKKEKGKKKKEARKWPGEGTKEDFKELDYSKKSESNLAADVIKPTTEDKEAKGTMKGEVKGLAVEELDIDSNTSASSSSMLSMFKTLVSQKELTEASIDPILQKYKDNLISKNVASEIATKLISAVKNKLVGQTIGTFSSIKKAVFNGLEESLVQILTPRRRVDILRDVLHAKGEGRPYSITFCGVNGVGKSTNLAKICFWLVENGFRIMIAACDTFRAGAVEQLKTHVHRINGVHADSVKLFEQGYGKDPATIAMHAISAARDQGYDVCLIDTAGRMQDNEPLMRALAKLIAINRPDAVLFVGEALVGNDAIDQLTKFNKSLANHSQSTNPRLIDGIVLSKFDTIDDKVGAAISMTYTTGQPIVFIGTGQTYKDLNSLNPKAVVNLLLR
ncbi:Oidioi.mRNA.OKI2018_I69.XSR.g16677.t1.cds [Oikopleura dioica]|uniref:Oidioi.mRNA.OKI2018_I69.XSR.g16677.t1.cds n=1 Tax=Oikopleura dioica TaxID=34765 RepID=A0ABN7SGX3_OIKDI|nr:Oidioi.mRNA.OKI2018_I69.XSR.g16677.t1.cds [Oikopleura dioica]